MRISKFNPHPFTYHQQLELEITSLTNQGQGVARKEGWVILVPFALPGEHVLARVYRNHKNYSEADLIQVLCPSSHRMTPPCPLFGICGGCQYQNLDYTDQLTWKKQQVEELLQRMVHFSFPVNPVIPSPKTYGYRTKITPHFNQPKANCNPAIGFLKTGRKFEVVDVPYCHLATEPINKELKNLRAQILKNISQYRKGATLFLRDSDQEVTTDPNSIITQTIGDLTFQFSAGDFFQNNPFILDSLIQYVAHEANKARVHYLLDAYCGSGLFCLSLAKNFKQAVGIEINETAIHWAQQNAQTNHISNCTFHIGTAASIFQNVIFPGKETVLIIDPPRRGSDPLFLSQLFSFAPQMVIYISCNPATQMRDLVEFLKADYRITAIQPFDLFPQTKHLECVITLQKKDPFI